MIIKQDIGGLELEIDHYDLKWHLSPKGDSEVGISKPIATDMYWLLQIQDM